MNFIHSVGHSVKLMSPDVISFSSCNSFSWICFHFPFGNFLSWVTLTSVCPETRRGPARLFGLLLWTCGVEEVTYFTGPSLQPPWSIIYTRGHPPTSLCSLFLRPSFLSYSGEKVLYKEMFVGFSGPLIFP